MKEFSKRVILMLTGAWFLCAVLGIAVVAVQLVRGDYGTSLSDFCCTSARR